MKAELTINTQEFAKEIAQEIIDILKPLLNCKEENDVIFDVPKLADHLGVPKSWVYKQVSLKTIPYFKVGKYTRFRKSDIDKWIDKETIKADKISPTRRL